jgi:hypothetical protein
MRRQLFVAFVAAVIIQVAFVAVTASQATEKSNPGSSPTATWDSPECE